MLAELTEVLLRPVIAKHCTDPVAALACVRKYCCLMPVPPGVDDPAPICADPDDQMFIDLAWSTAAAWLFSRDRALLPVFRLAQRGFKTGHMTKTVVACEETAKALWNALTGIHDAACAPMNA